MVIGLLSCLQRKQDHRVFYVNDSDYSDYPNAKPADRSLSGYLAAGCTGGQWIRNSLPNDPAALMQSFYTQIVARKPAGVPSGEDWKVFAPYLSRSLLQKIDTYQACMAEQDREIAKSDIPLKAVGLYEEGIFSGSDELAGPDDFHIESVHTQSNGSARVTVQLHWRDYMYSKTTLTWRITVILTQESGRYLLDDVVFLKDKNININADYTLSHILAMSPECNGRHWVGYREHH